MSEHKFTNFDERGKYDRAHSLIYISIAELDALRSDLAAARQRIAELVGNGFATMYSINQAITYDNEEEARKGHYGLPVDVVAEMNHFIQLLHDTEFSILKPPEAQP